MIATINSSRPVLARTVRCNPSASSIRLLVVRPVRAQSTTGEPHQRPAAAEQHDEEAKELQKQEQPSSSGPVVRPAYSVSRLPSILAEMQHEMDVLSRTFGMPRLWDDTEMLMHNFRPLNLMSDMAAATSQMPALRLATDIEESDKAFTIKADVPGMSKDHLKLQVLSNTLTISGERNEESREEGDKDKPARYERRFGSFSRSFTLPKNVDVDGITANAKDGVLTVTVPKVEAEKPKAKEIPVA